MPRAQPQPFTVEQRPVAHVHPYQNNPRRNQRAVAKVKASIAEFGFRQPIVVDEAGVIIIGHTRFAAALELGMASVPVHVAVGMSEQQVKALRIADNRTAEEAEWDFAALSAEMRDLGLGVEELSAMTAFDEFELGPLLEGDWAPPPLAEEGEGLGSEGRSHGHTLTFTPAQWEALHAAAHAAGGADDVAGFVVGLLR